MNGNLNDCGCCEGLTAQTPATVNNRPGLPAVAYRVGRHAQFKHSMLAALSDSDTAALQPLRTRDNDDFSIALLDGWATVADVLTFYQERIANELYLRTATERFSALQLARLIGYELRPGVAASTFLAFTIEDALGVPHEATIAVGVKVQSIPGPNEQPQTYETIEPIDARADWNALKPQLTKPFIPRLGDTLLYLKGTTANLKPGDALLLVGEERLNDPGNENWDFRHVKTVTPVPMADTNTSYTVIELDRSLGTTTKGPVQPAKQNPRLYALRQRVALFGASAPDWRAMPNSLKAGYLGLAPDSPVIPDYTEWPDFSIAAISDPPTDSATGIGLYGEYYTGTGFNARQLTRTDPQIDFDFVATPPAPTIGSTNFSVRWSGWIQVPRSGDYTFFTESDDGVRLWIDGKLLINHWNDHAPTPDQGMITLKARQKYDIKLEYYQHLGAAIIQLWWQGPQVAKSLVPASRLYPRDIVDVHLDAVYPQILQNGWVVLSTSGYREVYQILTVADDSRTNFTLNAKTTRLTLKGEKLRERFDEKLRETAVFAQSEELESAGQPLPQPVYGDTLSFDWIVPGLSVRQALAFHGKRARVEIAPKASPQNLKLDSGLGNVSLNPGDSLQVLEAPLLVPEDGSAPAVLSPEELIQALAASPPEQIQWHLIDRNGLTGFMTAATDQLDLVSAHREDSAIDEIAFIAEILAGTSPDRDRTSVRLEDPLQNVYDRTTVVINANVVRATHGESVSEILGNGDAGQPYQRFTLRQSPLTYVSASTPSGADTTLQVRVSDLLWHEAPNLFGLGSKDRVYITRTGNDGKTTVEFGDGVTGARLSSGQNNVQAFYRKGIGLAGLVSAGQLSLLLTRPLGVKSVTNPLATAGAADRDSLDDARRNAPLTVLTLDRTVSLQDYEDFTRAFAGIAKALASWIWLGPTRSVFVTVAGPNGAEVNPDSATYKHLLEAMQAAGDPFVTFYVSSYRAAYFRFAGSVKIDPDYDTAKVLAAVEQALRTRFSFDTRAFGQPVVLSEVIAVAQAVPGVVAAKVEKLYRADAPQPTLETRLLAASSETLATGQLAAAELLTLDPGPLEELGVMP